MVEMGIYAVKDHKIGCFHSPMFFEDRHQAVRSLIMSLEKGDGMLTRFAEDYSVWQLGTVDLSSGKLFSLDNPDHVVNVIDCTTMRKVSQNGGNIYEQA